MKTVTVNDGTLCAGGCGGPPNLLTALVAGEVVLATALHCTRCASVLVTSQAGGSSSVRVRAFASTRGDLIATLAGLDCPGVGSVADGPTLIDVASASCVSPREPMARASYYYRVAGLRIGGSVVEVDDGLSGFADRPVSPADVGDLALGASDCARAAGSRHLTVVDRLEVLQRAYELRAWARVAYRLAQQEWAALCARAEGRAVAALTQEVCYE